MTKPSAPSKNVQTWRFSESADVVALSVPSRNSSRIWQMKGMDSSELRNRLGTGLSVLRLKMRMNYLIWRLATRQKRCSKSKA